MLRLIISRWREKEMRWLLLSESEGNEGVKERGREREREERRRRHWRCKLRENRSWNSWKLELGAQLRRQGKEEESNAAFLDALVPHYLLRLRYKSPQQHYESQISVFAVIGCIICLLVPPTRCKSRCPAQDCTSISKSTSSSSAPRSAEW